MRLRWLWILLIQCAAALGFSAAMMLMKYLGAIVYGIALWGLVPLSGAFFAGLAAYKGLNNYLSWIAPPLMLLIAHSLVWAYLITPGPVLLCALISLIGAAAGYELRKRH